MRNMFQKNLLVIKKLWARSSHDPRMSTDGLDAVQNELKFSNSALEHSKKQVKFYHCFLLRKRIQV